MTRRLAAGAAGALLGVALTVACGKYGPPVRTHTANAPGADAAGESAQPSSPSASSPAGADERDSEADEAPR